MAGVGGIFDEMDGELGQVEQTGSAGQVRASMLHGAKSAIIDGGFHLYLPTGRPRHAELKFHHFAGLDSYSS